MTIEEKRQALMVWNKRENSGLDRVITARCILEADAEQVDYMFYGLTEVA